MKRLVLLLALGALLAGCGSSRTPTTTATTAAVPDPAAAMRALLGGSTSVGGSVRTLYQGSTWAVVQATSLNQARAVAFRLVGGHWVADRSGRVKLKILGPQPGATASKTPQVAIEFSSKLPFVESAIWVDGTEVLEKGGGSPTNGTIYGAPAHPLKPGTHVAVGYARTVATGSAVAWTFKVP
ncbi:MAG TPA: hypothetical protein VH063_10725 [Gaiellaceae bacterium]|nr:hypothetical protein [Gaiellaceae bacterium]